MVGNDEPSKRLSWEGYPYPLMLKRTEDAVAWEEMPE